jgi:hypothetical protein
LDVSWELPTSQDKLQRLWKMGGLEGEVGGELDGGLERSEQKQEAIRNDHLSMKDEATRRR